MAVEGFPPSPRGQVRWTQQCIGGAADFRMEGTRLRGGAVGGSGGGASCRHNMVGLAEEGDHSHSSHLVTLKREPQCGSEKLDIILLTGQRPGPLRCLILMV